MIVTVSTAKQHGKPGVKTELLLYAGIVARRSRMFSLEALQRLKLKTLMIT